MNHLISTMLENTFRDAFTSFGLATDTPIHLVESTNIAFGDYQVNGVMGIAKTLKINPRDLASKIVENIELSKSLTSIISKIEVAGPGFINITLNNDYLANFIELLNQRNKYGVTFLSHSSETVVVDLSSPNLAKEMHVGHLRSTVIGDTLARIFKYMGDTVILQNHVGDWGTQFGMLIALILEIRNNTDKSSAKIPNFYLNDLEGFYRLAKQRFDTDVNFANMARQYVVKLQSMDPETIQYWQYFRDVSLTHCQQVYDILGVNLNESDVRGESAYNKDLPLIIKRLLDQNLLVNSNGAKCVFFAVGELDDSEDTPYIVQKQDGGFLYSTTDLAAIDYRVHTLHANRIVYVVDARQALHFKQLFAISRKAGLVKPDTKLEHSAFGTMMNDDGRPFKTRDGGTVKLIELLEEAILRAKKMIIEKNPDWVIEKQDKLAKILAIDSVKYADLSKNRNSDYIFSFDKMLAFDGNTAPYLLYAYTRIQSVLKKAQALNKSVGRIKIEVLIEHRLGLQLARFANTVDTVSRECLPHYLCLYLYNLAGIFMQFYEECPILKSVDDETLSSRLALATLTAQILAIGLELLGIQTVDEM